MDSPALFFESGDQVRQYIAVNHPKCTLVSVTGRTENRVTMITEKVTIPHEVSIYDPDSSRDSVQSLSRIVGR